MIVEVYRKKKTSPWLSVSGYLVLSVGLWDQEGWEGVGCRIRRIGLGWIIEEGWGFRMTGIGGGGIGCRIHGI